MGAIVYEITHAGEGERGKSVEVLGRHRFVHTYAQEAADYFDDLEVRQQGFDRDSIGMFDGSSRIVEVVLDDNDNRYQRVKVRCRVERRYEVEELGEVEDDDQ